MENIFINEAFDKAIKDYLMVKKSNDEITANSFAVMVLNMLASIYGEVDIINPYIIKNEKSFKHNVTKFGYSSEDYEEFLNDFLKYYQLEEQNKTLEVKKSNPYFVKTQKRLIDMFCKKKFTYKVTSAEEKEFFNLLYTSKTDDPLRSSYNYLTASSVSEVEEYFYEQIDNEPESEKPKKSNVLNIEAYEILNYSLTDIANMDAESVDKVNQNVYSFFEIDEDAENKNDLLNSAIENYKRYNSRLTSGNGYVDILLVMGVVVTGILILTVASFIIF